MASPSYTGAAVLTAQVTKFQITSYDVATTYKITMNNKVISAIAAGSANATATALAAAWLASQELEMLEETASSSTDQFILTAVTAGKPFTAVSSVSGGTGTIGAANTTTANSGPEQYDLAANWSANAIPANGDTVTIEGAFNLRYGDLSAVTAAKTILRDFSGDYGLKPVDPAGYPQYRPQHVLMSSTLIDVMQNVSSSVLNFGVGSAQTTMTVYSSGSNNDTVAAVRLKGTHASNVLNILAGNAGIATESGEATTLATFTMVDGALELGLGCTLTDGTVNGGTLRLYADMSGVLTLNAGETTMIDDPDIGGVTKVYSGATLIVNGGPTFTGALSLFGGTLDLSQDTRPITTTAGVAVYPGATLNDPYKRLGSCTVTYAGGANDENTNINLGPNRVHAVSG